MSVTTDNRTALFASLSLSPWLDAGRVHRYEPRTLAAPAVWIGDVTQFPRPDGSFAEEMLQFEVVAVADGDDTAAREWLDVTADAVVDAARAAQFVVAARRATLVDVGGPTLRAVSVFVETPILAPTMCPPARSTADV